jgi:hypothetical protein
MWSVEGLKVRRAWRVREVAEHAVDRRPADDPREHRSRTGPRLGTGGGADVEALRTMRAVRGVSVTAPFMARRSAGSPLKESTLTDQKISPRFVFLGQALETTQVGPDSFIDAYPTAAKPQFEAAKAGDTVRIQLTGQDTGYQSTLDWPSPGCAPVEVGPALLEVLERAERDEGSKKTRDLAERIRAFFERTDR